MFLEQSTAYLFGAFKLGKIGDQKRLIQLGTGKQQQERGPHRALLRPEAVGKQGFTGRWLHFHRMLKKL